MLDPLIANRCENLADDHVTFTKAMVERNGHTVLQANAVDRLCDAAHKLFGIRGRMASTAQGMDRWGTAIGALIRFDVITADLFRQFTTDCILHIKSPSPQY